MRGLRRHAAPRLEAPRHLRRGGARVLRVAQRPHARAELAGRPRGQLRPGAEGAPHRVLLGLRRALLHVQGREAGVGEAGGARALPGRGEADHAAHPRVEALRRRGRAAGAVLVRGPAGGAAPAHGRRREPQGGHQQPGAVLRAEAERGTRIRELPEEHEVLRRWCEALNQEQEYRGQRLAGLAHEIFLKLLKAKREVPGAAERQKTLAVQDGKCALCGCGLTGACELDHVAPVRQAFAGSVQTLQALCGDCHSEKTLRESAQPTSLESRVAPGVMEYVRSPKLPPLF